LTRKQRAEVLLAEFASLALGLVPRAEMVASITMLTEKRLALLSVDKTVTLDCLVIPFSYCSFQNDISF
jgi:hypothetical protein